VYYYRCIIHFYIELFNQLFNVNNVAERAPYSADDMVDAGECMKTLPHHNNLASSYNLDLAALTLNPGRNLV
jgi:hypothetical protein